MCEFLPDGQMLVVSVPQLFENTVERFSVGKRSGTVCERVYCGEPCFKCFL